MISILKTGAAVLLMAVVWYLWGKLSDRITGRQSQPVEAAVSGFFLYMIVFQAEALPLILLKQPFRYLVLLWTVTVSLVTLIALLIRFKSPKGMVKPSLRSCRGDIPAVIAVIAAAVLLVGALVFRTYHYWDCAYYIGTMNEALTTDTMYLYNGNTGNPVSSINLRYALSSFYMAYAVICRLFGIPAIIMADYGIRALGILMSLGIVYLIARCLLSQRRPALLAVLIAAAVNLLWMSEYTTSQFFVYRLYEAKGYCANVLLPFVFYLFASMLRQTGHEAAENALWRQLFLVCLAAVPVSMSSLVILPVMILTGTIALMVRREHRLKTCVRGIVCMVPNGLYALLYLLYVKGLFIIPVVG